MRKGARVLDISRDALWNQEAVNDALESEHLASGFTDVTVPEPPPADHGLWEPRRMIMTPHIAADESERYDDIALDILFRSLGAARDGKAKH